MKAKVPEEDDISKAIENYQRESLLNMSMQK
jgi:hypothetical protein